LKDFEEVRQEFEEYQYNLEDFSWKEKLPSFQLYTSRVITPVPKVSVIIANYNNGPYLERMMNSLVEQTLGIEQIQVLFVDDCSTDNSLEIVRPYALEYPNIEIYQLDKNTGGAHGPRNVGILNARGEYVVFLDADDWYTKEALSYLSGLLDKSKDDFAVSGLIQSEDEKLTLKSKPYFIDGDFMNRSIEELPPEFYGWLGPQAIMLRLALVHENNLHFVNQRVADDVTFFYEALQFSKAITQGKELTTFLNRDVDNASLSRSINSHFMISWFRALSYINQQFPNDASKERFLSRRLEWLIYDFCLRRDTGYKFSKERLQDFKNHLDKYLGTLAFDPSPYFRSDVRQITWKYLKKNDINGLYKFVNWQSVRWVLYNKLGMKKKLDDSFYYPVLSSKLPKVRLNAYAVAEDFSDNKVLLKVFTHQNVVGFESRSLKDPFYSRKRLEYQKISDNEYQVTLPEEFEDKNFRFTVVFDNYLEIGVRDLKKLVK
jgi:glycosyltransferase involved in cell wall biosynthesis